MKFIRECIEWEWVNKRSYSAIGETNYYGVVEVTIERSYLFGLLETEPVTRRMMKEKFSSLWHWVDNGQIVDSRITRAIDVQLKVEGLT